jgi:transporter family-2 protein
MLLLIAVLAGVGLTVQVALNSQLRVVVGHPAVATLLSFVVGTLVVGAYVLAARAPLPVGARLGGAPWWVWLGGAIGAAYVLSTIVLAPRLGPGALLGAIVFGQMAAALVVEHFGWLGLPAHAVNVPRVAGALLIVAGVVLVRRF